jgi:hypothetical protein
MFLQSGETRIQRAGLSGICVLMNTVGMSITPETIQNLLDELEASKQSRLRAWNVLQRLRLVLSDLVQRRDPAIGPEDIRC